MELSYIDKTNKEFIRNVSHLVFNGFEFVSIETDIEFVTVVSKNSDTKNHFSVKLSLLQLDVRVYAMSTPVSFLSFKQDIFCHKNESSDRRFNTCLNVDENEEIQMPFAFFVICLFWIVILMVTVVFLVCCVYKLRSKLFSTQAMLINYEMNESVQMTVFEAKRKDMEKEEGHNFYVSVQKNLEENSGEHYASIKDSPKDLVEIGSSSGAMGQQRRHRDKDGKYLSYRDISDEETEINDFPRKTFPSFRSRDAESSILRRTHSDPHERSIRNKAGSLERLKAFPNSNYDDTYDRLRGWNMNNLKKYEGQQDISTLGRNSSRHYVNRPLPVVPEGRVMTLPRKSKSEWV